jgi:hypothetical protein
MLPVALANINDLGISEYLIGNNVKQNLLWTTTCVQSASLATDPTKLGCDQSPSLVTESFTPTSDNIVDQYTNSTISGYTTNGGVTT